MSTQKQRIGIKSDKRLSGLVARLWGTITQMDREHKSPPEDQTGARLTNRIQYFNWITVHLMFYQKADTSRPVHDTMPTVAIVGIIIQNEGRNRGASLCNDQSGDLANEINAKTEKQFCTTCHKLTPVPFANFQPPPS
ncbi:hypothetical protein T4E_12098 [Trichinella pseudospiralis]|uniref:Uncharacterized protein n=1 Tax=Trichinella pseudospiralis TaxID=6337 RepID=A0A0V0YAB8_TRIPS|nr:hypothetical protein T4E_12098 [Trichinella pseudospiralis]